MYVYALKDLILEGEVYAVKGERLLVTATSETLRVIVVKSFMKQKTLLVPDTFVTKKYE